MSTAKRKGLEFALNQIGNALFAIENFIGNTKTPGKIQLDFENSFIKLKGSTIFNDYDISKKDPDNIIPSDYNTFDSFEISDLAIQGGEFVIKNEISNFSNFSTWNPSRYSPPTPEGWLIYDYNAWSNYIPKYNASGTANTNLVIYDIYEEPSSGNSRTSYDYPVRFTGFGDTYQRVPLFDYASWISISNLGGSTVDEINLIISKDYFGGAYNIDPYFNVPNDLLIMSHPYLKSNSLDDPINLAGFMGTKGISDVLEVLPFLITECDENGLKSNSNQDFYKFDINLPIGYSWSESDYQHFAFYWGTFDDYIKELKQTYVKSSNTIDIHYPYFVNSSYYVYSKKNYFIKNLQNSYEVSKSGIFDTNFYLYSRDYTNNNFVEQKFNTVKYPFRYKLTEEIAGSSIGKTNSVIGFRDIKSKEYLPFIIACKNSGNNYDYPTNELELFYGFPISLEAIPENWDDLSFFPSIPENYIAIAKIVAKNSETNFNAPYFINNNEFLTNNLSIVYIEMVVNNSIKKSYGYTDISLYFSNSMKLICENLRRKDYVNLFNLPGQSILTKFLRYNSNKISNKNQFASLSSLEYKTLHALAKIPSDILLQNENGTEPKALQFNKNAANLISNFSTISPCTNIAGFSSTTLYFSNDKFNINSDFEIYLEKSKSELNDKLDSNRGSEKDYTFRIKFRNTTNETTIKDLYVNASKYFLNNFEYSTRVRKKLSLDGYFTDSTLININDFKIHSYAGLIPDLKFETYRSILNKYNSPPDDSRITESDYENNLLLINPNLTKDEIIAQKTGFGLTDSFYVVDLNKPSDQYNAIDDLGITITNYSQNKNSYWIDNTFLINDISSNKEINAAKHLKDLRSDSFIISKAGFFITDNSIRELENRDNQRLITSESSIINQLQSNGAQIIDKNKIAIKVNNDIKQKIKSFRVKLRKNSDFINNNSEIQAFLYSNYENKPYEVLATGSKVKLKNIIEKFKDFYFDIEYTLFENKIYWVVLEINQLPPNFDPYNFGLTSISNNNIIGVLDLKTNKKPNFERYLIGAEFGFGSTSGSAITAWYPIVSIGSSSNMTVSSIGTSVNNVPYSIKYKFEIGIQESSAIGASQNLSQYSATGWSAYNGTAFIEFHKPDSEIYAGFNRNFENSTVNLPPPNKYREVGVNKVEDFISFGCKQFFNDQKLYIYPKSIYLQKIEVVGSGISNSNKLTIDENNYDKRIVVGLGLSNSSYYSAGTSITNIIYDATFQKYNIYLSSNILNSFTDSTVGIGSNYNTFIKRANDINIILKYKKFSGTATTSITLSKSPTWITHWYSTNKSTYKNINKKNIASNISASYNLNFENYDLNSFMNGYAVGIFNPLAGIGTTFEFRFKSSGGLKVFLNDSKTPIINRWFNTNALIGATFSSSIASTSSQIKFEVHFHNSRTSSGAGQTLIGEWRVSGTSDWQNLDDSFYIDNSVEPILIDSNDIQSIEFMNCGKDTSFFAKPNLDSPLNDRLVIRSK